MITAGSASSPGTIFGGVLLQQGRPLTDRDWNDLAPQTQSARPGRHARRRRRRWCSEETPDGFEIASIARRAHDRPRPDLRRRPARRESRQRCRGVGRGPRPSYTAPTRSLHEAARHLPGRRRHRRRPAAASDLSRRLAARGHPVRGPDLVEKALGVDTTTRLQTVWQVKCARPVGATRPARRRSTRSPLASGDRALGRPADDRHRTVPGQPDPCLVPPSGGYKGLENQLYRVEIHDGGALGAGDLQVVARQRLGRDARHAPVRRSTSSSSTASARTTCCASRTAIGSRSRTTGGSSADRPANCAGSGSATASTMRRAPSRSTSHSLSLVRPTPRAISIRAPHAHQPLGSEGQVFAQNGNVLSISTRRRATAPSRCRQER